MKVWIDADSCPVKIRDIISKASKRVEIEAIYVANRDIPVRTHDYISKVVTDKTDQSADLYIMEHIGIDDIIITRDIPLANDLVEKGVVVLNDRGVIYTEENIKERLSIRDFMAEARSLGIGYERTSRFGPKDIQNFSNAFDKILRFKMK